MTGTLDEIAAKLQAGLDALADPLEGARDFARLNLTGDGATEIKAAIVDYERRQGLIETAQGILERLVAALDVLDADGFPTLPPRLVAQSVVDDFEEQIRTIQAMMAKFAGAKPAAVSGVVDINSE